GLLRAFGGPLVGPSANPSGSVSPTTAAHVRASFDDDAVLVLDGGPCRVGIESTVVSLADDTARVLRAGAIGANEIADALGEPVVDDTRTAVAEDSRGVASPGRFASHYAPHAPASLCGREELEARLNSAREHARRVVALVLSPVDVESADGVSAI